MRFLTLCTLMLALCGCAAVNVPQAEKQRSITIAEHQPPQIVFAPALRHLAGRGEIYALLSDNNGAVVSPARGVGEFRLVRSYVSAAGHSCAVLVVPQNLYAEQNLLACRITARSWRVEPAMFGSDLLFANHHGP